MSISSFSNSDPRRRSFRQQPTSTSYVAADHPTKSGDPRRLCVYFVTRPNPADSSSISNPHVLPTFSCLRQTRSVDSDPSLSTRRYPSREHRPPLRFGFSPERPTADSKALYSITDYTSTHRLSETFKAFAHQLSSVSIPSKLQDALTDQNWVQAMDEEMKALQKNCTWEIVDLPKEKKVVGC
ncbi:hypothetical protein LWI29_028593 [Acer saccharum]|uniref:Uncharacterized protein n=1 Tax=Acer saccharum TaxID=4024 RepID=A0AA39W370_ACESA|nr:hypothetical protein LWI29_028593 [Acer saccharum]